MSRSLGIPVKLLHEASGHVVTVELKSGELYRGSMLECEDNWNCQLENITYTAKDGKELAEVELFPQAPKLARRTLLLHAHVPCTAHMPSRHLTAPTRQQAVNTFRSK